MKAKDAAAFLGGISLSQLRVLMRTDERLKWYKYGKRAFRFNLADLEEYKALCQSHGTNPKNAGASSSVELLKLETGAGASSPLRNFFQQAGIATAPKNTTKSARPNSMPLRVVSKDKEHS